MTTTPRLRRERPKVIKLSDAAAARLRDIMEKSEGRYIGVRVGVKNGGCAGMSYTMDYAESQTPLDEVVEDKGVRILIDPKAVMFLIGTEMDFKRDKLAQRFIFVNPNQTEACGCGESVVILPAKNEADA
jgi:iron-sulfur cluster assembly protein